MTNGSRRTFLALIALAAFGCGGDTITQPEVPLAVSLQPAALTVLVGSSGQLAASATRGGAAVGTVFTYSIDKLAVATVTSGGTVFGVSPGTATVTASAPTGEKATSIITVTAAPPTTVEKTGGDVQQATSGTAVVVPPSVTVKNQFGQGVAGVPVVFTVQSGGGSVTGASQTTNANGVATVGSWVLGAVGINSLVATATGVGAATFVATATPVRGAITLGSSAETFNGVLGSANPPARTVSVTATGGTVGGLSLGQTTYDASATGWLTAQLASPIAPTNIVLTPDITGLALGTYTATVPVVGTLATNNPQTITVTLNVTATRTLVLAVSQQPGGAVSGNTLVTQPVVQIRDGNGAIATDVTDLVTVALVGAGGTLSGTTTVTAVAGVATFTDLRVTTAGDYTLSFTSPNATTATSNTFTVTAPGQGTNTVAINVGNAPTATVANGASITVPVVADVSGAQSGLASLAFTFTFDASKFDFQFGTNGSLGNNTAFTVNTSNVATGSLTISATDPQGVTSGSVAVYTITLKAKAPASSTPVTVNVTSAGDTTGAAIPLANVSVRPLAVTIP